MAEGIKAEMLPSYIENKDTALVWNILRRSQLNFTIQVVADSISQLNIKPILAL